ncbi:MAG: LTA synthase family protein [Alphaproteobacteria bacterium]|nr:LTA synthase family protein [Alphaproteobacteria bacterium]
MRRLRPSGDAFADAVRLGPVAMLIAHGLIARSERPARRSQLAPRSAGATTASDASPIVLVQCESFFDARRALPFLPPHILAGYEAACAGGVSGRLAVPAWGANTMRAEFQVLTGLDDAALGYDRFNPYHALARAPVGSHVWRLREAGYRTICLHPFDRGFFRRDLAMPALGFERFLGRETLGGARTPPYMSDPELARHILRVVEETGPRVFVFAITMGNHGPWFKERPGEDRLGIDLPDIAQHDELSRYLAGLRGSDEMLQVLIDELSRRHPGAALGFYGDHLPSLPSAFAHLDFDDWRSDYAVWCPSRTPKPRRDVDLAAYELGRVLLDLAREPSTAAARAAVAVEPHPA